MFEQGFSRRSARAIGPGGIVHIIVKVGNDERLYCSGGPGYKSTPTHLHRPCPKCLAAIRQQDDAAYILDDLGFPWSSKMVATKREP